MSAEAVGRPTSSTDIEAGALTWPRASRSTSSDLAIAACSVEDAAAAAATWLGQSIPATPSMAMEAEDDGVSACGKSRGPMFGVSASKPNVPWVMIAALTTESGCRSPMWGVPPRLLLTVVAAPAVCRARKATSGVAEMEASGTEVAGTLNVRKAGPGVAARGFAGVDAEAETVANESNGTVDIMATRLVAASTIATESLAGALTCPTTPAPASTDCGCIRDGAMTLTECAIDAVSVWSPRYAVEDTLAVGEEVAPETWSTRYVGALSAADSPAAVAVTVCTVRSATAARVAVNVKEVSVHAFAPSLVRTYRWLVPFTTESPVTETPVTCELLVHVPLARRVPAPPEDVLTSYLISEAEVLSASCGVNVTE